MSGGGSSGGFPGMLSQFDVSAFNAGLPRAEATMANRYNQLGLSGSTAEGMDLGVVPSLTGGIPSEFQAGSGQVQTQDLATTLQLALNNLTASNNITSANKSTLGNLLSK